MPTTAQKTLAPLASFQESCRKRPLLAARVWRSVGSRGERQHRLPHFGADGPSGKHPSFWHFWLSNYTQMCYCHFLPCGATVTNGVWRCGNRQGPTRGRGWLSRPRKVFHFLVFLVIFVFLVKVRFYSRFGTTTPLRCVGPSDCPLPTSCHSAVGQVKAHGESGSPAADWRRRFRGLARRLAAPPATFFCPVGAGLVACEVVPQYPGTMRVGAIEKRRSGVVVLDDRSRT